MREKLGMALFAVVLVVVWGVGFLWVRGDLKPGKPVAGKPAATSPADPTASVSTDPETPKASPGATYTGKVRPAEERKPVDLNPAGVRPRPQALPPVLQFTMATFNLLGSSHSKAGAKNAGMASGPQRMSGALAILAQHRVSIVGLQEFQPDQRAAFQRQATGWAMYPGLALGRRAGENSLAWRTDTWELVKPALVPIPYFNGRIRPMPYLLMRNKQTGVQAYFSTFHNPADIGQFQHQQRFRSAGTSREITLFNELEKTGIPQFVTGDMNERDEYFCRITGSTPLIAAAGGSNNGGCAVPRPTQIDWIFGSPGVQFGGYTIDRSPLVRRTTDHPVVVTQVVVDALKFKNAYAPKPATVP